MAQFNRTRLVTSTRVAIKAITASRRQQRVETQKSKAFAVDIGPGQESTQNREGALDQSDGTAWDDWSDFDGRSNGAPWRGTGGPRRSFIVQDGRWAQRVGSGVEG